ncbi:TIGR02285 family protein [Dongshaea marina]|uniref:TIGR02285 family protein n=1 Tax=Dongshaea marina TaxID=2047966 RepID=UPI00131EF446|nr:TIGR02285 family protein [Dongshaea marina]
MNACNGNAIEVKTTRRSRQTSSPCQRASITAFLWLLLLLISGQANASEPKPRVVWADVVLPPYHHIPDGPWKNLGITDGISAMLMQQMPGFEHERKIMSGEALFNWFKKRPNVCNPAFKKTKERESFLYYSIPSVFIPANGIAFLSKNTSHFGKKCASLQSLLRDPHLKIGISRERAYGKAIDNLLKANSGQLNMVRVSMGGSTDRLLEMILRERIDYALGYAVEFGFFTLQLESQSKIKFLPICEASGYTYSHIVCSKTPEGKKIIHSVNQALLKLRPQQDYRQIIERWLTPDFIPSYRTAYDRQFLTKTGTSQSDSPVTDTDE